MTELIRSLPKQLRKNFVPAPNFAEACTEALTVGENTLANAMSSHLRKMTGTEIPYDAWNENNLDDYLFFNYRVISTDGKTLKESRDLIALQHEFSNFIDKNPSKQQSHDLEQDNVDASILDSLPAEIELNNHGITIKAYPVLSADGTQVNVRILNSPDLAQIKHHEGLRQLFINALSPQIRHLKSSLKDIQNQCLKYTSIGTCEQLKSQLIQRLIDQLFTQHKPRSLAEFNVILDENRANMDNELKIMRKQLTEILDIYQGLQKQLKRPPLHWLDAMSDVQDQLNHLLHKDFIATTEQKHFIHLSRYLKAIEKRLQKIQDNPARDRKARMEISSLWSDYKKRADILSQQQRHSSQLEDYRWMLEEYRISLFAQEIKTLIPVSAKRLKKAWSEISDA